MLRLVWDFSALNKVLLNLDIWVREDTRKKKGSNTMLCNARKKKRCLLSGMALLCLPLLFRHYLLPALPQVRKPHEGSWAWELQATFISLMILLKVKISPIHRSQFFDTNYYHLLISWSYHIKRRIEERIFQNGHNKCIQKFWNGERKLKFC